MKAKFKTIALLYVFAYTLILDSCKDKIQEDVLAKSSVNFLVLGHEYDEELDRMATSRARDSNEKKSIMPKRKCQLNKSSLFKPLLQ